jgi:hypothetical protein
MKTHFVKILLGLMTALSIGGTALPALAFGFGQNNGRPAGYPDDGHSPFYAGGFPGQPGYAPNAVNDNMAHDRARRAMQQGEILPLSNIRHRVHERFGGKIIGVELQEGGERPSSGPPWVYDLRVLSPEGRVLSVLMDASDGRVLDVRGQR